MFVKLKAKGFPVKFQVAVHVSSMSARCPRTTGRMVLVLLRTSAAFASDDFEDPNHPPINAKGVVFRALSFFKRM
jgi:hypothetical protein